MKMVALIPARGASKRVPGKNTRCLGKYPLIRYSIAAAQQSGVFDRVVVCSDDPVVWKLAYQAGVEWYERTAASDEQPDIVWVREVLEHLTPRADAFAILRPTSPFRTAETIQRAYRQFTLPDQTADSLRAVWPVREHPYKMWVSPPYVVKGAEHAYPIVPLHKGEHPDGTPWHSSPTQSLPTVYVQTSALEMAWTRCVEVYGTISGRKVAPFFGAEFELFSIDTPMDWQIAEAVARDIPDMLPAVDVAGVQATAPAQ
jgi:CMP-N,N'-diacetyllegionaminic acid synthase